MKLGGVAWGVEGRVLGFFSGFGAPWRTGGPQFEMHSGGIIPQFEMHSGGIIPQFEMYLERTIKYSHTSDQCCQYCQALH